MMKITKRCFLIIMVFLSLSGFKAMAAKIYMNGQVPAFPWAEGYGAMSQGGRGDGTQTPKVFVVNTLEDVVNANDGLTSLREAISFNGPRFVVFNVSGYIYINRTNCLSIQNPYITIAGQTAPGGGITIRNYEEDGGSVIGIKNDVHDVIIQYLRLRAGNGPAPSEGGGGDNLDIGPSNNVLIDHVSMSWGNDQGMNIFCGSGCGNVTPKKTITNITIQNSIIAEMLYPHNTGFLIGGTGGWHDFTKSWGDDTSWYWSYPAPEGYDFTGYWQQLYGISIHSNYFAHNGHRNPLIQAKGAEVINNVVYNWNNRVGEFAPSADVDYIGNYMKPGPLGNGNGGCRYRSYIYLTSYESHISEDGFGPEDYPSVYVDGNIHFPIYTNPSQDNWNMLRDQDATDGSPNCLPGNGILDLSWRRFEPLSDERVPVTITTAEEAYVSVLADAGANKRLDCYGNFVDNRDSVDSTVVQQMQDCNPANPLANGAYSVCDGPANASTDGYHQDYYGGYPVLETGTSCVDSDADGLPDVWEIAKGLNPNDSSDSVLDLDGDGYLNIEEYIYGLEPVGVCGDNVCDSLENCSSCSADCGSCDGGNVGGGGGNNASITDQKLVPCQDLSQKTLPICYEHLGGNLQIEIYDNHGRKVRALINEHRGREAATIIWDGKNDSGVPVASGIYNVILKGNGKIHKLKMAVVR